ncbi:MAG: BolA family protein [Mariprofundaceae bacterium]
MRAKHIHQILTQAFQPTTLNVEDESYKHAGHAGLESSSGGHFVVHICSESFTGKSTIACHRMVNLALKEEFKCNIHALSIHTKSP